MEAICSSETSVETQRTTRRHIPEKDDTLHNHRCENLKSYKILQNSHCLSAGMHNFIYHKITINIKIMLRDPSIYNGGDSVAERRQVASATKYRPKIRERKQTRKAEKC
jgi:hypothetical protein